MTQILSEILLIDKYAFDSLKFTYGKVFIAIFNESYFNQIFFVTVFCKHAYAIIFDIKLQTDVGIFIDFYSRPSHSKNFIKNM